MSSKTSIEDLIAFAKKERLSAEIVRNLYKYKQPYIKYSKPFNKKQYLETTILIVNGKAVRPTEADVAVCIKYLRDNDTLICRVTVESTVRKYLRGELEISPETKKVTNNQTKSDEEIDELIKQICAKRETIKEQEERKQELRDSIEQNKENNLNIGG